MSGFLTRSRLISTTLPEAMARTASGADEAQAGFRVGYESPSQFSREYRRRFGEAAAADAGKLRALEGRVAA